MGLKLNSNKLKIVIIAILYLILITNIGIDHPIHITNAHYFNYMIKTGNFKIHNPYFNNGKQYLWNYGILSNLVSGIFYFIFGKFTLKILNILFFTEILLITNKHIKNDLKLTFFLLLTYISMPFAGAYPYFFSFTVFFIGYFNKNKSVRHITKVIAGINHVFFNFFNLFFFKKNKKLLILTTIILIIQGINLLINTDHNNDTNLLLSLNGLNSRFLILCVVLLIVNDSSFLKKKHIKRIIPITTVLAIIMIIIIKYTYSLSNEDIFYSSNSYFLTGKYYDLPYLNKTTRLTSLMEWHGLFEMQLKEIKLSTALYYHEQKRFFNSEQEYINYLNHKNISYVVLDGGFYGSYEHELLEKNFDRLIQNDRYSLYEVKFS